MIVNKLFRFNKIFGYQDIKWFTSKLSVGPIVVLLFIKSISNFTYERCVLNMFADGLIIYTSADDVEVLKHKLETYLN